MTESQRQLGTYVGRPVYYCALHEVSGIGEPIASKLLVAIDPGRQRSLPRQRDDLLHQLIRLRPLGVFFLGGQAEPFFDRLLVLISEAVDPPPTMTSFSSAPPKEAIEEFLYATWPADGSWDDWSGYLVMGDAEATIELEQAVRSVTEGSLRPDS